MEIAKTSILNRNVKLQLLAALLEYTSQHEHRPTQGMLHCEECQR